MLRAISNIGYSGGGIGLKSVGVIAANAAVSSVTGTTSATVLATVPIPAIAPGQKLRIEVPITTNVATSKTFNFVLAGVNVDSLTTSTNSGGRLSIQVYNTANGSQQVDWLWMAASASFSYSAATPKSMVLQNPSSLVISCTPGTTAETDGINGYSVELLSQ